MMQASAESIRTRCESMADKLRQGGFETDVVATESVIGGGTTPGATLQSFAVSLCHADLTEEEMTVAFRRLGRPVIARTRQQRVLLDLRTVAAEDDAVLVRNITALEKQL